MLDELARLDVRATFFVVGEQVARHPELVERTLAEGHEVELHCMRHIRHTRLSAGELRADTAEGIEHLRRAGAAPRRWRPPYMVAEWWTPDVAREHGLELCGGSCDPRDWAEDGVEAALTRAREHLEAGRVVVMHDGVERGEGDRSTTLGLLEPLVSEARATGLRPASMGEGRAFWWLRVPYPPDPSVSYRVVEEDDLAGEERAAVHALLSANLTHGRDEHAERGYRVLRPAFRVLAYRGDRLVGTTSTVWVRTAPAVGMAGLSDGAVDPRSRGAGIGSELMRRCIAGAAERGAGAILADTTAYARFCARHGFRRPEAGELRFEAADGRPRHWWLRWEDESRARPLELIDDDF